LIWACWLSILTDRLTTTPQRQHNHPPPNSDVKPENVILLDKASPEGYFPFAKLLDFGLSKMIGQDDGSAARTFVGTPCYLAP
jgi:serine/threonine protein kinase